MPSPAGSKAPPVSTSPLASSSMTSPGGTRPPVPTTVAAGGALPDDTTLIEDPVSSVVVRLSASPPGRNSDTRPLTCTRSPTATAGAEEGNTNSPSEVACCASGLGSWNQKPPPVRAVTTPRTPATVWPLLGERWLAPWMSWIGVASTTLTVSVQVADCGAGSSLWAATATEYVPLGVLASTVTLAVAVSPGAAAGTRLPRTMEPGAGEGVTLVMAMLVTVPSASVAPTWVVAATPLRVESGRRSWRPPAGCPGRGSAATRCCGVRARRRAGSRATVAAQRGDAAHQGDLATGRAHADGARVDDVRRRQRQADRGGGGLLDEQVLARRQRDAWQLGELAGVGAQVPGPGGAGVLQRPAAHRGGCRAPVEQLDVVVGEGRSAVPAATVDLADDDVGRDGLRRPRERGEAGGQDRADDERDPDAMACGNGGNCGHEPSPGRRPEAFAHAPGTRSCRDYPQPGAAGRSR